MTIVLAIGLCNALLYNAKNGYENTYDMRARIGHKNTYDMRVKIHRCRKYNTYQ